MCMRGLYNFRYGEHFGFSVSHTTRQPRPGRKKTLNGCYLNDICHDHDNIIINFYIKITSLPLLPSLIFWLSLFDWIIIMVITGEEDGKDYHFVTRWFKSISWFSCWWLMTFVDNFCWYFLNALSLEFF